MTTRLVMSDEWNLGDGAARISFTRPAYHEGDGYCIDHRTSFAQEEGWMEHVLDKINQENQSNTILRVLVTKSPYPGYPGWYLFQYMFIYRFKQREYRMMCVAAEDLTTRDYLRHIYEFIQR